MSKSKYFTDKELACRCCGVNGITPAFLEKLDELREKYGKPIILNSAFRCPKHNQAIGGSPNSQHVLGLAVDISCTNSQERAQLLDASYIVGFRGRGIAKTFVHLDLRAGPPTAFLY